MVVNVLIRYVYNVLLNEDIICGIIFFFKSLNFIKSCLERVFFDIFFFYNRVSWLYLMDLKVFLFFVDF